MSILVENKEIARRFVGALNEHDAAAAASLVADEFVDHGAPVPARGAGALSAFLNKIWTAMPDMRLTCEDVIAEGDRVVCRVGVRATQTGPIEFLPFPVAASGRALATEHIHVFRIANGKIAEHWIGRDDIGMLRQLGHLPRQGAQ